MIHSWAPGRSVLSRRPTVLVQTTMSPSLPPETLDTVIDHLHDELAALKACCTVSKSWVPRTRRHLFARVEFNISTSNLEAWKETFPDPSNSPAHYTRSLSIYGITDADDWIRAFLNVEHLLLQGTGWYPLIPFYALSPAVRSLHLIYTTIDAFELICSFPLLEDLVLFDLHPGQQEDLSFGRWNAPSTSPKLTGSLDLRVSWEFHSIVHKLCSLPNGLHFTNITLRFVAGDARATVDLVSKCSDTLESLIVNCFFMLGMFPSAAVIGQYLTAPCRRRNVGDAFP